MPDTHLILHVKGTEDETARLPKQVVRAAISQGQITHSQLIWSPTDNAWKQVRELPHLWPSQKLAPAPPPRPGTIPLPEVNTPRASAQENVPRIAQPEATPAARAVPRVKVATPRIKGGVKVGGGTPSVKAHSGIVRTTRDLVVKEESESHPLKWLCIILGLVILGTVGVNYLMVDQPLVSRLGQTSYSGVPVYAHLGAFMQPNVLVIHIRPSSSATEANLPDLLVALAHSTPETPFADKPFDRVALTSAWTGQYSFSGYDWKLLGDMEHDSTADRKEFILEHLGTAGGEPLLEINSALNDDARQAERDKVWESLASTLVHP